MTQRADAACQRALEIGARTYGSVRSILDNRLDGQAVQRPDNNEAAVDIPHPNIRGTRYYR